MSVSAAVLQGGVLQLTLEFGKGNILCMHAITELSEALARAQATPQLKAVVLRAAGNDFCFGASVEEHRSEVVARMLQRFHGLLEQLLALELPTVAVVHGRCLGGGLELALAASRLVADASAKFGAPEIKLGVFAPAASVLLPPRVGQAAAEDLLLTGRVIDAPEAVRLGLVDELCDGGDPAAWAVARCAERYGPLSGSSLRLATRAVRHAYAADLCARLSELERLYLLELMRTDDAREGIEAFLAHRPPRWAEPPRPA